MRCRFRAAVFVASLFALPGNASAELYNWFRIPHLAAGGGYISYLTIADPHGASSRSIYVSFFDDNGNKLALNVAGTGRVDEFNFRLGPLQAKTYELTGGAALLQGWVQIAAQGIGTINASLRFATSDGSGKITDAVGILPAEPNSEWTVAVEKVRTTDETGVAISNPWTAAINGYFELRQGTTRVQGTAPVRWDLKGLGHKAVFVSQIFPGANYSGVATLRIYSSDDTFSAVALRADESQYSSLTTDAGVQHWSVTYTESTAKTASWAWRFHDGYTFVGYEQNSDNSAAVRLRGVLAGDVGLFTAEWTYVNEDGSKGTILFQGIPGREGNNDVINGVRIQVNRNGEIVTRTSFKATRVS